jgi:hypothetical protein
MAVLRVPPEIPPLKSMALTLSPISASGDICLRALFERKAAMSDGMESKPLDGIMMAPVCEAA